MPHKSGGHMERMDFTEVPMGLWDPVSFAKLSFLHRIQDIEGCPIDKPIRMDVHPTFDPRFIILCHIIYIYIYTFLYYIYLYIYIYILYLYIYIHK